jgi:hypothetical protein
MNFSLPEKYFLQNEKTTGNNTRQPTASTLNSKKVCTLCEEIEKKQKMPLKKRQK